MKVTPVSEEAFPAGLVSVNVRLVVPPTGMLAAPNALLMLGGVPTVSVAVAWLPVVPVGGGVVEVTLPVVLVWGPEAAPVTVTLNVHGVPTTMVAPDRTMLLGAVVVRVPPQTPAGEEVATVTPLGRLSVNPTPASATGLPVGLVMVKFSEDVAFRAIVLGLNTLAIDGGATTVRDTVLLVLPVPASFELIGPVVLLTVPGVELVTFTERLHDVPVASDMLLALTVPLPTFGAKVPPQVFVVVSGLATVTPLGKGSLNCMPVRLISVLAGLVMVKPSVEVPPEGMLDGLNDLLMVALALHLPLLPAM